MAKHGEQIKVAFNGYITRTLTADPVSGQQIPGGRKYYRMNFNVPGTKETASVRSDENLSGKAGIVMFVQKGQPGPNNTVVQNDAWTLVSVCDAGSVASARAALEELNKIEL